MLEIKLTEKEQIEAFNNTNLYEISEYEGIINAQLLKIASYLINFSTLYNSVEFTPNEKLILLSIAQKIKSEVYDEK